MCLRINNPAISRVGSGGCPGPTRQTELKRPARNCQSISAARRTSGWRRLMISSRGGQTDHPDDRRVAGSRLSSNSESRRQRNHEPHKSGIPKRKKTETHPRLSCKIQYLLSSNYSDASTASEFFTGDALLLWILQNEQSTFRSDFFRSGVMNARK